MIERKKKLRIIQLVLLFIALIVIFFTYLNRNTVTEKNNFNNISEKNNDLANLDTEEEFNIFFNIEYSGIDLSGNRYILKSSEAKSKKLNQEIVNMKGVEAVFYFKDGWFWFIIWFPLLQIWQSFHKNFLEFYFIRKIKQEFIYVRVDLLRFY